VASCQVLCRKFLVFALYDAFSEVQRANGLLEEAVYRDASEPNRILVLHRFASHEAGEAFMGNPEVQSAIAESGVDMASASVNIYEDAV
jgi:quinol monooxygenase YgiN